MLNANTRDTMSPKEREEFEQEKEAAQIQIEYQLRTKELELEVTKIEARWTVLLKLPMLIVKLPVMLLFGLALIVSVITKKDLPREYWNYLNK